MNLKLTFSLETWSNIYMSSCIKLEVVVHFKLWHRGTFCWKQNVTFFSFTDCRGREIKCHCVSWNLLVTRVNQKDISFSQWETEVYATCSRQKTPTFVLVTKQSCLDAGWKKRSQELVLSAFQKHQINESLLKHPTKTPRKKTLQLSISFYKLQITYFRDKFYPTSAQVLAHNSSVSCWGLSLTPAC